jgi:peptidoglycan/xylan/chitin deacetylase (PgdA/CDA1 family)
MTISPSMFRRQVEYLARHHRIVGLDEALQLIRDGVRLRRPVGVITFDDGYQSVYDAAAPELRRLGLPGTCFVCTDLVDAGGRLPHDEESPVRVHLGLMGWRELEALRAEGWTIGAHSATHARLSRCHSAALRYELERPQRALRERMDLGHLALAYPFGGRDDVPARFSLTAREAGYSACLSNLGGENRVGGDLWSLCRIDLGGDHESLAWRVAAHGLALSRIRTTFLQRSLLVRRDARAA